MYLFIFLFIYLLYLQYIFSRYSNFTIFSKQSKLVSMNTKSNHKFSPAGGEVKAPLHRTFQAWAFCLMLLHF